MARDFDAEIASINAAVAGLTVPGAFLGTVAATPDGTALRSRQADGTWQRWTWTRYAEEVSRIAAGLQGLGVSAGDRMVLLMRNRPEFHTVDTAAQFLRAVPVSIYNSSSAEEITYQAGHCEAVIAVVEDSGFMDKVLAAQAHLPKLRAIVVVDPGPASLPDGVIALEDLTGAVDLAELAAATRPEDLATLIYTSGTTGPPKGVMISQYNAMYTCASLRMCFAEALVDRPLEGLRVVSYLPMAHIAERMSSHYQGIVFGLDVATCPDPGLIAGYCREIKPESMFGVPRVWEKVYAGVNAALAADPDKAAKFADAIEASKALVAARQRGPLTEQQQQTADFLDTIVFAPVRAMVGLDAALLIVSGAAPIPKEIIEWFQAIGVPVTEIYGLSETSGPMTWEARADYVRPGTVGRAIPGCGVRLADDGEIICRGGNVFVGYFKAPEKTAEVLHDGWFYSGDIGTLDDDGYVRIVDRKKELIITAGGKNISPANLEAALKTIPLVGQACAIGDQRKFVSALLVLDPEYAPVWAGHHGVEFTSLAELAAHPLALAEVEAGVEAANRQFAQVEQIKRFTLLGEEWLPDSDLLTPTSKLKRRGILARYAAEIEAMYG